MEYCTEWKLVGLAIALAPFAMAVLATFVLARSLRPIWVALPAALPASAPCMAVGMPVGLVLWNGIRPAACNSTS